MFRCSPVVRGGIVRPVVPVVKNFVARRWDVCVVLLPNTHSLGFLNQIIAGTLYRDYIRIACLDRCCAGRGGAVCVVIGYGVAPGERLIAVICVNDRGVAPVGTLKPDPALHNAYDLLSCLCLCHTFVPSFFLVKSFVLLAIARPLLLDGFALIPRFLKL